MAVKNFEQTREKVAFPLLRELLVGLIRKFHTLGYCGGVPLEELTNLILSQTEYLKISIFNYKEGGIDEVIKESKCDLSSSIDSLQAIIQRSKESWQSPNEFFLLFDIAKGKEAYIDEKINEVLGISPDEFKVASLDLHNPSSSIYYEEDVYHVLRFAMISYFILALPCFKWSSQSDHTLVRFRLKTNKSRIEAVQKLPYITVEKRCYLVYDNVNHRIGMPQYHFDIFSVYPHLPINYVTTTFVTKDNQGEYINSLAYVLNMVLIGIPPKYVLLLDERQRHDRNKMVAKSLCNAILHRTGKQIELDEHQVADCFAKTIRQRVEDAFNTWDFRSLRNRVIINSDTESVLYAKKLGLLPIPALVKDMLYEMVISV
ncbi:MAG: hypothetical protein JSR97_00190 [Verrucomicrobia bacterium]|nr:hypothetical protein [Verrucomicrobiota bacterium]